MCLQTRLDVLNDPRRELLLNLLKEIYQNRLKNCLICFLIQSKLFLNLFFVECFIFQFFFYYCYSLEIIQKVLKLGYAVIRACTFLI